MKLILTLFLLAGPFFLRTLSAQFPSKIEYTGVLGEKCEFLRKARAKDFLERKADNLNYPLFRWTSDQETEARYPGYGNSPKLFMFDLPVCEMIVRFDKGRVKNLYTMFYNRGDMAELDKNGFHELRNSIQKKLESYTGDKGFDKKEKLTKHDLTYYKFYVSGKFVYEMKWSIRKQKKEESYEYIQLEIYPFDPKNDPRKKRMGSSESPLKKPVNKTLASNLKRKTGEGMWIENIPMVDQGQKGYCIPAVLERVLRYYGNEDVTQHVLAQIAESEASSGTNGDAALKAVKDVSVKLGVRVSDVYTRYEDWKELEKILKKYNSFAEKMNKPEVQPVVKLHGNTRMYYIPETVEQLDPEVAKKFWTSQKADYGRFQKFLKTNILKGIPVIWSVNLGVFPEEGRAQQTKGGHMRLIIGLSERRDRIYFSDTWGAGHERKSMPIDEAWTITQSYFVLTARK